MTITALRRRRRLLLLLISANLAASNVLAATSADLERLINLGQATEAYRIGTAGPRPANDATYDYFLGVAAVDAGNGIEGAKILEAYVARNPADLRARLELARAWFLTGENEKAKREFETAKAAKPPAEVVANIDAYLRAIDERTKAQPATPQPSLTGYAETGLGHDTNVNSGVSSQTLTLPVAGAVVLDQSGARQSAAFARFAGAAQLTLPVSGPVSAFAGINLDSRFHSHNESFNNLYGAFQSGAALTVERHLFRASVNYNTLVLNRSVYRTSPSLMAEWQVALGEKTVLSASVQQGRLAYTGANFLRDGRFTTLTTGLRHGLNAAWNPVLVLSANTGRERNYREREDFSRNSDGGRVGFEVTPVERLTLSAGYSMQSSRHIAEDLFFAIARNDRFKGLDIGASYVFSQQWSMRAELSVTETKSNLDLFSNRRAVGSVNVRYGF